MIPPLGGQTGQELGLGAGTLEVGPPNGCQKKTVGGGVRLDERLDRIEYLYLSLHKYNNI